MDVHSLQTATLFHADPGRPSGTPESPDAETAAAPDIIAEVRAAMARSVAYQVIRTNLQGGSRLEDPVPTQATESTPAIDARLADTDTSIAGASLETVVATAASRATETRARSLEVTAGDTEEPQQADPLLLDLDGNGFETLGAGRGIDFDIDADGRTDRTSFASGGDAFLALDRNGNGTIDDGGELFGDQHGAANGYRELARFDDNRDGRIDAYDPVFARLVLVRADEDGRLQTEDLHGAGIRSISLVYEEVRQQLAGGDLVTQSGSFTRTDGNRGSSADVLVGFHLVA